MFTKEEAGRSLSAFIHEVSSLATTPQLLLSLWRTSNTYADCGSKVAMCRFVAGLFTIVVITTAAAQSCPANQIASDAQIISIYNQTMFSSADIRLFANSSDPNNIP